MNAVMEFERHQEMMRPDIADTLSALGEEVITAYGSLHLRHNTLSAFVPRILEEGLRADSTLAVPDPEDVAFAEELFLTKGDATYDPNARPRFNRYVKGTVDERQPGVFFYGSSESKPVVNAGYGMPERMYILASEMNHVMHEERFSDAERQRAAEIFSKYWDRMYGAPDAHRAVIEASPFSPSIIDHRLSDIELLAEQAQGDTSLLVMFLENMDRTTFEGIYIPNDVPAADLTVLPDRLAVLSLSKERNPKFSSRFYGTPPQR